MCRRPRPLTKANPKPYDQWTVDDIKDPQAIRQLARDGVVATSVSGEGPLPPAVAEVVGNATDFVQNKLENRAIRYALGLVLRGETLSDRREWLIKGDPPVSLRTLIRREEAAAVVMAASIDRCVAERAGRLGRSARVGVLEIQWKLDQLLDNIERERLSEQDIDAVYGEMEGVIARVNQLVEVLNARHDGNE